MKYDEPKEGEWVHPKKKGYKMMCCDCGLVHKMEFEHFPYGNGRAIQFRVWRDERATSQARRRRPVTSGATSAPSPCSMAESC